MLAKDNINGSPTKQQQKRKNIYMEKTMRTSARLRWIISDVHAIVWQRMNQTNIFIVCVFLYSAVQAAADEYCFRSWSTHCIKCAYNERRGVSEKQETIEGMNERRNWMHSWKQSNQSCSLSLFFGGVCVCLFLNFENGFRVYEYTDKSWLLPFIINIFVKLLQTIY